MHLRPQHPDRQAGPDSLPGGNFCIALTGHMAEYGKQSKASAEGGGRPPLSGASQA